MTEKTDKEIVGLLRTILLNTKPYNQNWEFPHTAKTEVIHQKLRSMLAISDAEWRDSVNKDTQNELKETAGWKEMLSKGVG